MDLDIFLGCWLLQTSKKYQFVAAPPNRVSDLEELLQIGIFERFVAANTPKKYQGPLKLLFLDEKKIGFMQIRSLSSLEARARSYQFLRNWISPQVASSHVTDFLRCSLAR